MTLSIIIVSYNTAELLLNCIGSVYAHAGSLDYEILVVDNNSSDGSAALVKGRFPDVKLIHNDQNVGFARANNQGYMVSKGKYVLLLNPDTIVREGALARLARFLDEHQAVVVVGPRLLNIDGTLQVQCRRGFPRLLNSIAYGSGLSRVFPKNRVLGSYLMTYMDARERHEVDAVSGACMLVRRSVVEGIGGLLDEAFFMHFEDIDLCFRCKEQGHEIWYVHDSEVIHLKGQSSKFRNRGVKRDFFDSALVYFKKNYRKENWLGYYILSLGIRCARKLTC
jgi:GT2 family glycosyltransferase